MNALAFTCSVMPGENVVKAGDICRELRFVQAGTLNVCDAKGTVIDVITSQGTGPCICGAVSFLMGAVLTPATCGLQKGHAAASQAALCVRAICACCKTCHAILDCCM